MPGPTRHQQYWQRNLWLTASLLALWFIVTFAVAFGARDLQVVLFGWPVGFWAAAQGALIVYCAIIWIYAHRMNALDEEFAAPDGD